MCSAVNTFRQAKRAWLTPSPIETPSGPLSGLTAGLERLRTSHLLVLAIDLPNVSVGYLRKLCGLACRGRGVIPVNGDRYEPLCAVYPRRAAAAAREALASGDVSLQHL